MLIKRKLKFLYQRLTRGWDDSDTWNLEFTISKFVLPRLKRFKEVNNGHPGNLTEKEWDSMLDDMIFAHEEVLTQYDKSTTESDDYYDRVKRGLKCFGEYYQHLWW